jgi:hypothetical protein
MKQILVLILGVIAGFFAFEAFASARPVPARKIAAARNAPASPGTAEEPEPSVPAPAIPESNDPAVFLARARPASTRPMAFYFSRPTSLYGNLVPPEIRNNIYKSDRAPLRNDPEFMAKLCARVVEGLENDLDPIRRLLGWDTVKSNAVVGIATEQLLESIMTPVPNDQLRAAMIAYSEASAPMLAKVLSPEELEAFAELLAGPIGFAADFRGLTETFASRGLTPLTREQFQAMLALRVQYGVDEQPYRVRRFEPSPTLESLDPGQRTYLENLQRWTNAQTIVNLLHTAKVRDPEVWEIWPE